jgi:putative NADH-flavin reductase
VTRIVVFGASGGIGREVVAEALRRGLTVRAFARDASKLPDQERVELALGDVTDAASVREAVRGVDAVVWALGATRNTADQVTMFETGARNLVGAMQEAGVTCLVALSGAGVTVAGERKPLAGRLMSLIVSVAADRRWVGAPRPRETSPWRCSTG